MSGRSMGLTGNPLDDMVSRCEGRRKMICGWKTAFCICISDGVSKFSSRINPAGSKAEDMWVEDSKSRLEGIESQ